jgi:hypothetical protein
MTTKKENLIAIKLLHDRIKNGKDSVSTNELEKAKVDISLSTQTFRNVLLKKDFFGDWVIRVNNDSLDLNGNPISENKKLISRLKALWENDQKKIKVKELNALNIYSPANTIDIQNFRLTDNSMLVKYDFYDISLIDKNKNIDGLWIDKMIGTERILDVLNDFSIKSTQIKTISELDLNKLLENHFKKYFENVKKGGTSDKGLIDLIIGDMIYGIELKLGRELRKTTQADRAIGQIDRYMEKFGANFMVVIAGTQDDKNEKSVQNLIKKIRNSKGTYYYLEPCD